MVSRFVPDFGRAGTFRGPPIGGPRPGAADRDAATGAGRAAEESGGSGAFEPRKAAGI